MGVRVKFWKGAWWVFINHQGKRKAKRIGDRETALAVAKAVRTRIAAGELRLGPTDDETLETYAGLWVKGLTRNLKASTIAFYGDNLRRHVLPALGRRPIGAITRADCRELVAGVRAKGLKLNTVRGIARTLVVLSQAVEMRSCDPWRKLDGPGADPCGSLLRSASARRLEGSTRRRLAHPLAE